MGSQVQGGCCSTGWPGAPGGSSSPPTASDFWLPAQKAGAQLPGSHCTLLESLCQGEPTEPSATLGSASSWEMQCSPEENCPKGSKQGIDQGCSHPQVTTPLGWGSAAAPFSQASKASCALTHQIFGSMLLTGVPIGAFMEEFGRPISLSLEVSGRQFSILTKVSCKAVCVK